jgi:hypothetical protein
VTKHTDKLFFFSYDGVVKGRNAMVSRDEIRAQLKRINADSFFMGRPEIRELPHILFEGEQIEHLINGRYEGGFATLVVTDQRVLLIDKKPFYLTLEDIRYDMISDVMFNHRLLDASVILGTIHKSITFLAYNPSRLRHLTSTVQQKVMDIRRQQAMQQGYSLEQIPQVSQPSVVQNMIVSPANQTNPYKNSPILIRRRVSRFY